MFPVLYVQTDLLWSLPFPTINKTGLGNFLLYYKVVALCYAAFEIVLI